MTYYQNLNTEDFPIKLPLIPILVVYNLDLCEKYVVQYRNVHVKILYHSWVLKMEGFLQKKKYFLSNIHQDDFQDFPITKIIVLK